MVLHSGRYNGIKVGAVKFHVRIYPCKIDLQTRTGYISIYGDVDPDSREINWILKPIVWSPIVMQLTVL